MKLEESIRHSVELHRPNATGFHPVRCKVCDDYKVRAGFKFQSDGVIIYNCFRGKCDATCVYTPLEPMSYKFKNMLKAFGVTVPDELLLAQRVNKDPTYYDSELYAKHEYTPIKLNDKEMVKYNPRVHAPIREYLDSRGMTDDNYFIGIAGDWKNRLILPCYIGKTLIGWEGLDINHDPASLFSPYKRSVINQDMIWLPDGECPYEPVIVEGIFDAKSIPNGVAVLHSTVSNRQAYFFREKRPILLPDRTGSRFMEVAKKYGWRVIVPPYQEKDPNAVLQRCGRLVLAEMLRDNIYEDYSKAELKYQLWENKIRRTTTNGKNSNKRRTKTTSRKRFQR